MSKELITAQVIKSIEEFEKQREKLKKLLSHAKNIPTPKKYIKKKGEFATVEYHYMNEMMDDLHPRRSVRIVNSGFYESSNVFWYDVEITDLETGESRSGTGLHPMIIYKSGTDALKSPKEIRELMSNAKKAALTEAMRDAYAHFGVAADLYGLEFPLPVTNEQVKKFQNLSEEATNTKDLLSDDRKEKFILWWKKNDELFKTCTMQSADQFLDDLNNQLTEISNNLKGEQ